MLYRVNCFHLIFVAFFACSLIFFYRLLFAVNGNPAYGLLGVVLPVVSPRVFDCDARQWFDSVMTDMYFLSRILRQHGIVIIRNVWSMPVRKALMFYIKNLPYALEGFGFWETWLVRHVPIVGELVLRLRIRPLDLCVLRLTGKDSRSWGHFNGL